MHMYIYPKVDGWTHTIHPSIHISEGGELLCMQRLAPLLTG